MIPTPKHCSSFCGKISFRQSAHKKEAALFASSVSSAAAPFPGFCTAGFSSCCPQSRRSIPRGFFLGFVMAGRSFLPVGIEKGQSIFSAVPYGRFI